MTNSCQSLESGVKVEDRQSLESKSSQLESGVEVEVKVAVGVRSPESQWEVTIFSIQKPKNSLFLLFAELWPFFVLKNFGDFLSIKNFFFLLQNRIKNK